MNMKIYKFIVLGITIFLSLNVQAVKRQTKVFMYGFAASFNDSIVYITDIQTIDSAWVDSRTGFLYSRNNYSYQLRDFLQRIGVEHPTCITAFAIKRKDIEKKYLSIKKRYTTKGKFTIKYIEVKDFQYRPMIPNPSELVKENVVKTKPNKQKMSKQRGNRPQPPRGGMDTSDISPSM